MKRTSDHTLRLSATDVASFLSCRHRTPLEMGHAVGKFPKPQYDDPQLESFFQRGLEHEAAYVEVLKGEGRGRAVEIDGKAKPDDAVGMLQIPLLAAIAERYKDGYVYEIDGVSVEYPDWHFNVRGSNTEPLLRLNLEAKTQAMMEAKRDEVLAVIRG